MRLRLALLVLLLIGLAAQAHAQSSQSPDALEWGWWSRTLNGQLPAPPTVPSDGLAVGTGPDGPTMISAVRVALGSEPSSSTILELRAARELEAEVPSLVVCPADPNWAPARGGRWQDRPYAFCVLRSVPLTRVPGQPIWRADLFPVLEGETGVASLAIVPDPWATRSSPFELHFQRPAVRDEPPPPMHAPVVAPSVPVTRPTGQAAVTTNVGAEVAPPAAPLAVAAPRAVTTTQWGRRGEVTGYTLEVPLAVRGVLVAGPVLALFVARTMQLRRRRRLVPGDMHAPLT